MTESATAEAIFEELGMPPGSYNLKKLTSRQRLVSRRLTEAASSIPSFSLTVTVEMENLITLREEHNAKEPVKLSLNDLIVKAAAVAVELVKEVNASYSDLGIAEHHNVDIAIAVASKYGLITPIVRAANKKTPAEIAGAIRDLSARANEGKLQPAEYTGGSFCVSNLGMFDIENFTSIINPPHSAILSVGSVRRQPRLIGDDCVAMRVMTVTLTCDHRLVDGTTGARWLSIFKDHIQNPICNRPTIET